MFRRRRISIGLRNLNLPRLVRRFSLYVATIFLAGHGFLAMAAIKENNSNLVLGASTQEDNFIKQRQLVQTLRTIENQIEVASSIEMKTDDLKAQLKSIRTKVYASDLIIAKKEIIEF